MHFLVMRTLLWMRLFDPLGFWMLLLGFRVRLQRKKWRDAGDGRENAAGEHVLPLHESAGEHHCALLLRSEFCLCVTLLKIAILLA